MNDQVSTAKPGTLQRIVAQVKTMQAVNSLLKAKKSLPLGLRRKQGAVAVDAPPQPKRPWNPSTKLAPISPKEVKKNAFKKAAYKIKNITAIYRPPGT